MSNSDIELYIQAFCALSDKPFLFYFTYDPARGQFALRDTKKLDETGEEAYEAFTQQRTLNLEVPAGKLYWPRTPCPHCGDDGLIRCGTCKTWVCRGNTTEEWFYCRPSCGKKTNLIERPIGPPLESYSTDSYSNPKALPCRPGLPAAKQLRLK